MLHHIDNNFVSLFSSIVPPLHCFGTTRRNSLHCVYDLFLHNERSLFDCMSYQILSVKFCSIASLSTLIYYYIVILLHNTFIETPHHHCFSFLSTCFLLLILNSRRLTSFKISVFVADHDICAAKDDFFLYMLSGFPFHSFVCSVFSPVCRSSAFSAAPSLHFSTVFVLGLHRSFLSFILSCLLIHLLLHSFIQSLLYVRFGLI